MKRKSGGPRMIVDRLVHYSDDSTSVYCVEAVLAREEMRGVKNHRVVLLAAVRRQADEIPAFR